jgi:hypothetical protein
MENQVITDTKIGEIKQDNIRVRIVGRVVSFDEKTGIFELEDDEQKITCMANMSESHTSPQDLVLVTGRAIAADSSFEVRADSVESINIKDYNNYKKYLKIRNNLLNNNGS